MDNWPSDEKETKGARIKLNILYNFYWPNIHSNNIYSKQL